MRVIKYEHPSLRHAFVCITGQHGKRSQQAVEAKETSEALCPGNAGPWFAERSQDERVQPCPEQVALWGIGTHCSLTLSDLSVAHA